MTYAKMTLNYLKTGMIVTTRNGNEYTVIRDRFKDELCNCDVFVRGCPTDHGWIPFSDYCNDLTCKFDDDASEWDIVKVERGKHPYYFMDLSYCKENRILLWAEPAAVKLTVAEIEARLGYKIEIVSEEE